MSNRANEIINLIRAKAEQEPKITEWESTEKAYEAGFTMGRDQARDEFKDAIENIVSLYRGD
jgi:hypothetical protein